MTDPALTSDAQGGPRDRFVGRILGRRYEALEHLARGGMGHVYRARQVELGRECALKVMDPRVIDGAGPDGRARFLREAKVAARVAHPNVVAIFDFGEDSEDGACFIAMELLSGETLEKYIRRVGRVPYRRAVDIACQIARGLRAAHDQGVIHRDLKPGNVFLIAAGGEAGHVKIVDFGLGKLTEPALDDSVLTETGIFLGSPRYASPEQIASAAVDERSDIYGVGVVLFQMLTGVVPFDGPHDASVLLQHLNDAPRRPRDVAPDAEIPEALEGVVLRCLAKRPDARFASAADLVLALRAVYEPPGSRATQSVAPPRVSSVPPATQTLRAGPTHTSAAPARASIALSGTSPTLTPPARPAPRRAAIAIGAALAVVASAAVAYLVTPQGARAVPVEATVAPAPSVEASPSASTPADDTAQPAAQAIASARANAQGAATRPAAAAAKPVRDRPKIAPAPAVTTGRLFVWIDFGTCRATVDGIDRGMVPTGAIDVPAGPHAVTCKLADGTLKSANVDVGAGKSASVRLTRD